MNLEYSFILFRSGLFLYPAAMRQITLNDLNLNDAERLLCEEALTRAGSIVEAARMLGITRHALKRRIIKHRIEWPRQSKPEAPTQQTPASVQAPVVQAIAAAE